MFQVNNKNTRTTDVVLMFLLLNLNIFQTFFLVFFFVADFEQVNVSWIIMFHLQQNIFPK